MEQAAQQLGQVRQAQQAAEQQLSMLLNYQDEYRQKLNHTLCDGMDSSRWQNYQQFIGTLEQAIDQHRQQCCSGAESGSCGEAMARQTTAAERFRDPAYPRSDGEQQQENKRDQKLMDEFAQRSAQRNINP